MKTMGAFEAKTYLSKMLAEVEETGQRFIIKKRGKNIALLIPFDDKQNKTQEEAQDFLKEMRNIRKTFPSKIVIDDIKEMIEEGRH